VRIFFSLAWTETDMAAEETAMGVAAKSAGGVPARPRVKAP
jgi:hypothetical protein